MDSLLLSGLREKYTAMLEMRRRHERGDEDLVWVRSEMRALAARFPGALRELDELPLSAIESRLGEIDVALAGGAIPTWARILAYYHGYLRVALRVKRRFRELDAAHVHDWIRSGYRADVGEPTREELIEAAPAILRPPGGRLSQWVLTRLTGQLGLPSSAVHAAVAPPRPRLEMLEEN